MNEPTTDEKRARVRQWLLSQQKPSLAVKEDRTDYRSFTYDMFMFDTGSGFGKFDRFASWIDRAKQDRVYAFESERLGRQGTDVELRREDGEQLHLLNFSSYNYLGLGYHPEVIEAAQDAVAKYGLGANSSPIISGTNQLHRRLEQRVLDHFGRPNLGVSLFSSGYCVNLGTIQAICGPGDHVVLDRSAHMSLLEGARLSGAKISYFAHNDAEELESILQKLASSRRKILVAMEGVYSAGGDFANLRELIPLCKKHGAFSLVDEAHSYMVAGTRGLGVSEEQQVLEDVDLYVATFSKACGGVGGALIADRRITQYVNWYAKCRMFSCALDPAVTGGMIKAIEIGLSSEGDSRRARIRSNSAYLAQRLRRQHLDIGNSQCWLLPVFYGDEKRTLELNDYLHRHGLDSSPLQFPAVEKNLSRIRLFVTSEHTTQQLDAAARIVGGAGAAFQFVKSPPLSDQ